MRKALGLTILISVAILMASNSTAQHRKQDYRGKTYIEIRIDDEGIILVDTAGNETMVPVGAGGDEDLPDISTPPVPTDADFNPDDYPIKISSIRKIGQSITIREDEHVLGDVTVVGGDAVIKGLVDGTVTVTGDVRITGTGIVLGSVLANEVTEEQGAQIFGHVQEKIIDAPNFGEEWNKGRSADASESFTIGLVVLSLMFFFTFVVAMLFRKPTDRIKSLYSRNILKTLLVGFLAWILVLPVFILLCITIVGIPLAVLGVPLAMVASAFLGGAAFALFVGDFVRPKNNVEESRMKKLFVGFIISQIPTVGFFLGLILDLEAMAIIFGIMAILLNLLVVTLGFGGSILTRFGSRDYRNEKVRVSVEVVAEHPSI